MAINNWRYVVTWGFREPDGTIVEERQWVPSATDDYSVYSSIGKPQTYVNGVSVSSNTFSPAETYKLMSDWYANQWNTALADAYWNIANNLWAYSNFANTSLNNYDALLNYIRGNEQWLQSVAWKLYWNLVNDIQSQRDYINQMFGPNWELTKEVNTYYDDLWNYLATDAWRQAAKIAAQWMHSWASLWAIRAQQNEAYNESFWRYIQAKEQQINAKQQIASNLINYMSTLRQEYWDTTNQYIIDLYKRANDMYNAIAQSAAADIDEYNKYRIAINKWESSWSNSAYTTSGPNERDWKWYIDYYLNWDYIWSKEVGVWSYDENTANVDSGVDKTNYFSGSPNKNS